jgi:hypothetical protein
VSEGRSRFATELALLTAEVGVFGAQALLVLLLARMAG